MSKIAVFGGGSWGTTLADMLAEKGENVHLWVRETDLAEEMLAKRENTRFLPGKALHPSLQITPQLPEAMRGADVYLIVVPCQFMRRVLESVAGEFPDDPVLVCASKGIEQSTMSPMSKVVAESLQGKNPKYAVISGPSFAAEVSRRLPTAVSLGCPDPELGQRLQKRLSAESFRVYVNEDFRGVELGGALKNVMAIAAGISDGLGFGHDARAAPITRGLAEMSRLGEALGARARTYMGLAGMDDLVLTCTGDLSRNRQVELKIGRGMRLKEILEEMNMVAEGVKTAEAVHALGRERGVDLPISEQVYAVLFEDKPPEVAVRELMTRALKYE
ncbi:MAG: NAD(P)H-dependent glycerol-3-phosphate dehydrogenase [Desulfonatronovibrionaceae bacterium]